MPGILWDLGEAKQVQNYFLFCLAFMMQVRKFVFMRAANKVSRAHNFLYFLFHYLLLLLNMISIHMLYVCTYIFMHTVADKAGRFLTWILGDARRRRNFFLLLFYPRGRWTWLETEKEEHDWILMALIEKSSCCVYDVVACVVLWLLWVHPYTCNNTTATEYTTFIKNVRRFFHIKSRHPSIHP